MPSMNKETYNKFAIEFLRERESLLANYDAHVLAQQIREWERVVSVLDELIKDLSGRKELSLNQLRLLKQYKEFIEQAEKVIKGYAKWNSNITMIAQKDFANIGLSTSGTLLNLIDTNWNRLEVDAINGMIGRTAEGSPLYNLFMDRFSVNVDKAVNSLVDGISRGLNPNEVARNMRSMLDISIYDSTRITRTEALNVYRNVAYNQYVSSGIVDSYNWITEQGACSVCLGFSRGNPYPLSKIPQALHPFDRCSIAPNI